MIREVEDYENPTINVFLKNGETFINKDIPDSPLSDREVFISFWKDDNTLVSYPLESIEKFEFVFNTENVE